MLGVQKDSRVSQKHVHCVIYVSICIVYYHCNAKYEVYVNMMSLSN